MNLLGQWLDEITPYIHIEEPMDFKLLMAAFWANQLPGIKVWLILRGPSASGGTRMLDLFHDAPGVLRVPELTHPGFETLLKKIDKSGDDPIPINVVIIVDMTYILGGSETDIHHDFRLAYDGSYGRQLGGNRAPYIQKRTFGLMAKATNAAMDNASEWASKLGPRTIELRLTASSRRVVDPMKDTEHRKLAAQVTRKLILDWVKSGGDDFWNDFQERVATIENPHEKWIEDLSNFVAHARAYIDRDDYDHTLVSPVDPEHPNRLFSQFDKLVRTLAVLEDHERVEREDVKAILRVAIDSIPSWRYRVLEQLKNVPGDVDRSGLKVVLNLTHEEKTYQSVERDLQLLGMIDVIEAKDAIRLLPGWEEVLQMWREEKEEEPPHLPTPSIELVGKRLLKMWRGEIVPEDPVSEMAEAMERAEADRLERLISKEEQPVPDVEYDEYGRARPKKSEK